MCVAVRVFRQYSNFWNNWPLTEIYSKLLHLDAIAVKLESQGHMSKFKVTRVEVVGITSSEDFLVWFMVDIMLMICMCSSWIIVEIEIKTRWRSEINWWSVMWAGSWTSVNNSPSPSNTFHQSQRFSPVVIVTHPLQQCRHQLSQMQKMSMALSASIADLYIAFRKASNALLTLVLYTEKSLQITAETVKGTWRFTKTVW